jgi:maltose/moltooligosaccharide transporter
MTDPKEPTPSPVTRPLSASGIFWYSLANIGYGAFYAFNNFVLPLWLQSYTHSAVIKGLLGGSHSFEGVFIQPVIGSISDRLAGPGGRRRPFMRLFILISAVLLVLTPAAALLPPGVRLGGVVGCIFLFTLTFNVAIDPYQALLADITTEEQRGKVTGTWYFIGAMGQVLILILLAALLLLPKLHIPLGLGFALVGVLMLTTTLLTCARTPEPYVLPPHEAKSGHWADISLALAGLQTLKQARLYMVMFFLYGAGIGAVTPNLTTFIKQVTGCGDSAALGLSAFLLVMTAIGSLAFGPLSDRLGFQRMLMVSLALVAAAAANALWITSLPQVAIVLGIAGLGIGAQNASAYPLLTRLVPVKEIGFYVGLQTGAASLAGPGAVLLAGWLIDHHSGPGQSGYRLSFAVCAVCLLLALVALSFLREPRAAAEVAAREQVM